MSVWGMRAFGSRCFFVFFWYFGGKGEKADVKCMCKMVADVLDRFKSIAGLVKETKQSTKEALQALCKM